MNPFTDLLQSSKLQKTNQLGVVHIHSWNTGQQVPRISITLIGNIAPTCGGCGFELLFFCYFCPARRITVLQIARLMYCILPAQCFYSLTLSMCCMPYGTMQRHQPCLDNKTIPAGRVRFGKFYIHIICLEQSLEQIIFSMNYPFSSACIPFWQEVAASLQKVSPVVHQCSQSEDHWR